MSSTLRLCQFLALLCLSLLCSVAVGQDRYGSDFDITATTKDWGVSFKSSSPSIEIYSGSTVEEEVQTNTSSSAAESESGSESGSEGNSTSSGQDDETITVETFVKDSGFLRMDFIKLEEIDADGEIFEIDFPSEGDHAVNSESRITGDNVIHVVDFIGSLFEKGQIAVQYTILENAGTISPEVPGLNATTVEDKTVKFSVKVEDPWKWEFESPHSLRIYLLFTSEGGDGASNGSSSGSSAGSSSGSSSGSEELAPETRQEGNGTDNSTGPDTGKRLAFDQGTFTVLAVFEDPVIVDGKPDVAIISSTETADGVEVVIEIPAFFDSFYYDPTLTVELIPEPIDNDSGIGTEAIIAIVVVLVVLLLCCILVIILFIVCIKFKIYELIAERLAGNDLDRYDSVRSGSSDDLDGDQGGDTYTAGDT